jgi:hypothetical protein
VLGIERDLESMLYPRLGVSGPNGQQICKDLAQEPLDISVRREALNRRLDRLKKAQTELLECSSTLLARSTDGACVQIVAGDKPNLFCI